MVSFLEGRAFAHEAAAPSIVAPDRPPPTRAPELLALRADGDNDRPVSEPGRILLADDDPALLAICQRILTGGGFTVDTARDGESAAALFEGARYDAVVSDINMPGLDGVGLLERVRQRDLDVPVVLMTGAPTLDSAIRAVEHGALRYLTKPFLPRELRHVVERAVRLYRVARLRREALVELGQLEGQVRDLAGLSASFQRALGALHLHYQPIVSWSERRVFGFEALVRSREPTLPTPSALFDAAERLGRLVDLGRAIRGAALPAVAHQQALLFVNLHPLDLNDEALFDAASALSSLARQVVLEITERASLVADAAQRIAVLRRLGYRIAVDDLGAGYAGLSTLAVLEPEVVKIDMSLSRGIDGSSTKRKLVRALVELAGDLGAELIVEGVETVAERDTLAELGCDLQQGFLFALPGPDHPDPRFE